MQERASERIWSNQEAVVLRRPNGGYMLVCTSGRAAFLSDFDAQQLRIALGIRDSDTRHQAPSDAPSETQTPVPITFTREPQRRNKPKSRKSPKRPAHRKAPTVMASALTDVAPAP